MAFIGSMAAIDGWAAAESAAGGAAATVLSTGFARSAGCALSAGLSPFAVMIAPGCDRAPCASAGGEFPQAGGCGSGLTTRRGLGTVSAIAGDGSATTDGSAPRWTAEVDEPLCGTFTRMFGGRSWTTARPAAANAELQVGRASVRLGPASGAGTSASPRTPSVLSEAMDATFLASGPEETGTPAVPKCPA